MSREIKFRVYDHEHKTMGRVIGWSRYELMEDVGNVVYYVGDKTSLQPTDSERIAIMQYTGIKDKNGKEIYEGDIVEVAEYDCAIDRYIHESKHAVEWHSENDYPAFDLSPSWDGQLNSFSSILNSDMFSIRVIGNIHENKDLLQDVEG